MFMIDAGKTINLKNKLNLAILNALWSIITGEKFEYDEPKLEMVVDRLDRMMNTDLTGIVFVFPWLRKIAPGLTGVTAIKNGTDSAMDMFYDQYKRHLEGYQENEMRDFLDVYIKEMKAASPDSSFYGEVGMKNLKTVLLDLFIGGSDTTTNTLNWALIYLSIGNDYH